MRTITRSAMSLLGTLLIASAAVGDVTVTPGTSGVHWTNTNIGGKYQTSSYPPLLARTP